MRRREFITLLGGAAAWPLSARAQQAAIPVVGYLSAMSEKQVARQLTAFRRGLNEVGFVEGQNIVIEFRWADGQVDRLPALAADLVRRPVTLIVAQAPPAALAASAATKTIPTVFVVGFDPVAAGLVASFNRPGGNATGMTLMNAPLGQKRLELLRELAPKIAVVAMLTNPGDPDATSEIRDVEAAARAMRLELRIFGAANPSEIAASFAAMAEQHLEALLVGTDPLLVNRRGEVLALAAHLGVPAIYGFREFAESGGLISYGTSIASAYRQAGNYVGRILKGEKPADLPVMQPTTFELIINLKTAKSIGLTVPDSLLARADEVIE
jgi:putative tryptophan/tyrosine transport system substrate-binding protein